jgi:hypothetical protein
MCWNSLGDEVHEHFDSWSDQLFPNTDVWSVRRESKVYKGVVEIVTTHTYLDGIGSFMYPGLWAAGTLHSTATLSIQRVIAVCMSSGSCTV